MGNRLKALSVRSGSPLNNRDQRAAIIVLGANRSIKTPAIESPSIDVTYEVANGYGRRLSVKRQDDFALCGLHDDTVSFLCARQRHCRHPNCCRNSSPNNSDSGSRTEKA